MLAAGFGGIWAGAGLTQRMGRTVIPG
jgi:hypothetical protein